MVDARFDEIAARLAEISDRLATARDPQQRVLLLKEMRQAIEQAQNIIQLPPVSNPEQ